MGVRLGVVSRAALLASLVGAAGCDALFLQRRPEAVVDAGADAPPDASPDAQRCYGANLLQVCLAEPLPAAVALAGSVDTGTDARCTHVRQSTGREVCVIAAQAITVPSAVTVHGPHPLALISASSITIEKPLDASSNAMRTGPGAQPSCGSEGDGTGAAAGAGGGAGGTFGWRGGGAQPGGDDASTAHAAPLPMPETLVDLRGGCPGYAGGVAAGGGGAARGGAGGGALWLIATTEIVVTVEGSINASGAGGEGGPVSGGGGGGGAGGLIGLEAPRVRIEGHVFARGAGGGSGGSTTTPGNRGHEAINATLGQGRGAAPPSTGTGAGPGWPGCGGPNGGDGGRNTAGTAAAGGGGGGGACGILRVVGDLVLEDMITSPAPT